MGLVAGFALARAFLGALRWSDLATLGVVLALEPFIEWMVHSWILHSKPFRLLGRTISLSAARGHRLHHEDPTNLSLVFVKSWVLVCLAPALCLVSLAFIRPLHLAATALAAGSGTLLAYEWTHYLIHTSYRPRRWLFRRQWHHHRLHHYRNEAYWFGVTTSVSDLVLRTCPRGGEVPVSPTARTLG